jgi:hypothetical protein
MKVVVCGDSFMARALDAKGRHFSELLGNDIDVVNLAAAGVSNTDICYQLKEAVAIKPDFVIFGTTDSGRTEMPYTDGTFSPEHMQPGDITLRNFRPGPEQVFVASTINTFIAEEPDLKHNKHKLSDQQRLAVKLYFIYMYFNIISVERDSWMTQYWISQLEKNNIQYKLLPRDFCIYTYAQQFPGEHWSFHTDFATQAKAAKLLREELLK